MLIETNETAKYLGTRTRSGRAPIKGLKIGKDYKITAVDVRMSTTKVVVAGLPGRFMADARDFDLDIHPYLHEAQAQADARIPD